MNVSLKRSVINMRFPAGSACTAGEPSHVLQAIGRSNETSRVLRISLSDMSSLNDVKLLIELLKNI